ncbi:hypothetical protein LCGC14_1910510, partial [marine sediment metagenome]
MKPYYQEFLSSKAQSGSTYGFNHAIMPSFLFDFQELLIKWALKKGRAGIFADCGLGKTPMQLVWADNVIQKENKPVLILAPLAVSSQTVREGEKFSIECHRSSQGKVCKGVNVTNYERLHYFNPSDFAGVVCDESSILKSFDGVRRNEITEFMRTIPYRLLCTATAAPNDYIELGTSSEALGELGYTDMLTRFFVNSQNSIKSGGFQNKGRDAWRFKGHAQESFWRWVSSWARAMRKPSDYGFNDGDFTLPPIEEKETVVKAVIPRPGMLFDVSAIGLREEHEVRRRTLNERCEAAASKVINTNQPAAIWCHLNDEGNALVSMIPGSKQISGADSDESKEEKFEAFRTGQLRVLIIKPKIGAFGLNWQHCAHVVYFPSDSYEQYYQAVRRCWRFGQTKPVVVDIIRTEGQDRMFKNLVYKAKAADGMFTSLVSFMNRSLTIDTGREFKK